MRIPITFAFALTATLSVVSISSPAFASRVHRAPTSGHSHTRRHAAAPVSHKLHGQQAIDSERVTAIQQALIREHYLTGEPSARWDADTQAAMLKFQADQGWQTKITPDSRALIKLGLGPNHSGAINGGNGVNFNTLASPKAPSDLPPALTQGFIAGSGASR